MDKTSESHDFMNVDSFSQLPFIRSAPSVKPPEKSIRLFGIEFGTKAQTNSTSNTTIITTTDQDCQESSSGGSGGGTNVSQHVKDSENNNSNNTDSSRKFECHYCCRNFPTSQALGGHQNAHKRERQHAKRSHLQFTTTSQNAITANSDVRHHHHLYGLLNYSRIPTSQISTPYPSWNCVSTTASTPTTTTTTTTNNNNRYNGFCENNRSSFGLWKTPDVHQNNYQSFNGEIRRSQVINPLPLSSGHHHLSYHKDLKSMQMIQGSDLLNRHVYESKANVQDHVSLDLRL